MNTLLPIYQYRDEIIDAVDGYHTVVVEAETGAGKSTQVPQYLHKHGYRVVTTQPRRLAARTTAIRVASEMGLPVGGLVGFRTSEQKMDCSGTKVLYCTDGLQLVRELVGFRKKEVLVIDEVHEWNRNIETLVAWAKYQLSQDQAFQVVLMSATIETERLSEYFGNCPIIHVSGREHQVEFSYGGGVTAETEKWARAGKNVLTFVPGKREIGDVIDYLRLAQLNAEILPLHGNLTPQEQERVFQTYDRPKVVVATNVAQHSVTIEDIDVVVDSGEEKRIELRDGVEGLHIGDISQADIHQRAGRAGRTKSGVYVLCSKLQLEDRPAFAEAEIKNSRLEQLVLRLRDVGMDPARLEFFHQPSAEAIADAFESLRRLGALDENDQVTLVGKQMVNLPVDVHLARMIVEAKDTDVLPDVLTIAACLEAGGVRLTADKRQLWRQLSQEKNSDLLAELDCYNAAFHFTTSQYDEFGINGYAMKRAEEIRARLAKDTGLEWDPGHSGDHREIVRICTVGLQDHLYFSVKDRTFVGHGGQVRQLDQRSLVKTRRWIAGLPFDVSTKRKTGQTVARSLITWASKVDPAWFPEELVAEISANPAVAEREKALEAKWSKRPRRPRKASVSPVQEGASREPVPQVLTEPSEPAVVVPAVIEQPEPAVAAKPSRDGTVTLKQSEVTGLVKRILRTAIDLSFSDSFRQLDPEVQEKIVLELLE